jgi:DNA-binding MarR family transcriptional regulator
LSAQATADAEIPAAVRAWTRLLRAHATTTRLLNAELQAQHGLTINDYEALQVLSCAEDHRLKRVELARRLVLTPSGVTRLLEGLERAGLVERTSCPTDLRVAYAQLTDAGLAKLREVSCGHEGSVRALFEEHLSPAELEQLVEVLGKVPGGGD